MTTTPFNLRLDLAALNPCQSGGIFEMGLLMEFKSDSQPLALFEEWMREAKAEPHIREATAMSVATLGEDGELSVRVVLCKEWSERGFTFYSNYLSRKGLDLDRNPHSAAVFYWDPLFRQVRISGPVIKTSREQSEKYWASRPRMSQLSQLVSRQSQEAPDRSVLVEERDKAEVQYQGKEIPCPQHWGGYTIQADKIEFWIGRDNRLHDRFEFEKHKGLWHLRRLYP